MSELAPDAYAFYFAALEGRNPPVRPMTPECGFYRRMGRDQQTRGGVWIPVAIYIDDDGCLIALDGKVKRTQLDEIAELFGWCGKHPVPEDQWRAVVERGEPWPDELPEREVDFSNLPDDPLESLLAELQGEKHELDAFLKAGILNQDDADRAANWKGRILDIAKRVEDMRVAEKKPHLDAGRAVDARFDPAKAMAADLKRAIDAALTPYLKEKARREAEERARQAQQGETVTRATSAKAGTLGRTVALTTVRSAVIEDPEALALYLVRMPHADMIELLQQLANRIARTGACPPGCKIHEEKVAR